MNTTTLIPDIRNWSFSKEIRNFSTPVFPVRRSGSFAVLKGFPDPEQLLESTYDTVKRYLGAAGYSESETTGDYRIETRYVVSEVFESWTLELVPHGCVISAGDTEGIRRGLYEFTDLLSAGNGVFPAAGRKISRRPFLKTRLGRCPFSPIKRDPVNVDELLDKTDYYPDALLDTLAHHGVNGIWIVTALRELGRTSLLPDDPQRERRIAKLRKTAEKCRKYGIRLYLFMIEPFSVTESDPLFKKHREMFSADPLNGKKYGWCPLAPLTGKYLVETFQSIFSEVPELGGVVNITLGERLTTCMSSRPNEPLTRPCLARCGQTPGEIVRTCLQSMHNGIRTGSPDAELIAWFYIPQAEDTADWVKGISTFMPEGVIPQFNFESGGRKEQLGRIHIGGDYWVSYDGPAPRFREEAELRRGQPMGAKLQLGCGHELTIIPGVPAPSIVYRKYRELFRLGITHVMQSWYIGNFPNIMTRAMGLASFRETGEILEDEETFLLRLAMPDWREDSETVVRAWKKFDEAYQNFPFNLMFQYYGPQNNMSEWRFHFLPDLDPLAMPWKITSIPGGDAIGEAMGSFTLDETVILFEQLISLWREGVEELLPLQEKYAENRDRKRDIGIAVFLLHQFQGTLNLLHFYALRRRLYTENDKACLPDMMKIVRDQQRIFREIIPLLEADSRLGFHGEALTRIFDENSVRKALAEADRALETAEDLRNSPLTPAELAFQRGFWNPVGPEWHIAAPGFKWKYEFSNGELVIRINSPANTEYLLEFWFMDATGCSTPRIEYLNYEKGKLIYRLNSIRQTDGYIGDTSIRFACEKTGKDAQVWIFRWDLKKLPPVDRRLPFLQFNFLIQTGNDIYYAFGSEDSVPGRLSQGRFSPNAGGCLEIPC